MSPFLSQSLNLEEGSSRLAAQVMCPLPQQRDAWISMALCTGRAASQRKTSCGPGAGEELLMGRVVCKSVSSMEKMLIEEQNKMLMEDAHCSSVPRLLPTPNPVLTLSSVPALGPG